MPHPSTTYTAAAQAKAAAVRVRIEECLPLFQHEREPVDTATASPRSNALQIIPQRVSTDSKGRLDTGGSQAETIVDVIAPVPTNPTSLCQIPRITLGVKRRKNVEINQDGEHLHLATIRVMSSLCSPEVNALTWSKTADSRLAQDS